MLHKPILTQSKAWLLYVCLLTMLAGCSKCNKVVEPANDTTSTAGLPPATQVGARTFGCMVNGKVWLPVRDNTPLAGSNPSLSYDATWRGGTLALSAQIFDDKTSKETLGFFAYGIDAVGDYSIDVTTSDYTKIPYRRFLYYVGQDDFRTDEDPSATGKLTITKLDQVNRIIAGTFAFAITKNGKTITVTDGRFDMKYL